MKNGLIRAAAATILLSLTRPVLAETQKQLINERLATVHDLELQQAEFKRDLRELEERLTYRLTLRLGGMLATAVAVVAALVKIL